MNQNTTALVKVTTQMIGIDEVNAVDARELWILLESKQEFATWIKNRIKEYDFTQDIDFTSFDNSIKAQNTYINTKEYTISIDIAKELSMVERNAKGKEARKYFIECEKKARQLTPNFADPAEAAIAWANEYKAKQLALKTKQIALDARDEAITTKAHIGDKKTATAMATASVKSRENTRLKQDAITVAEDTELQRKTDLQHWSNNYEPKKSLLNSWFNNLFK